MKKGEQPSLLPEEILERVFETAGTQMERLFLEGGIITNRGRIFIGDKARPRPLFFSTETPLDITPDLKKNLSYRDENGNIRFSLGYVEDKRGTTNRLINGLKMHIRLIYERNKVPAKLRRDPAQAVTAVLTITSDIWGRGRIH